MTFSNAYGTGARSRCRPYSNTQQAGDRAGGSFTQTKPRRAMPSSNSDARVANPLFAGVFVPDKPHDHVDVRNAHALGGGGEAVDGDGIAVDVHQFAFRLEQVVIVV